MLAAGTFGLTTTTYGEAETSVTGANSWTFFCVMPPVELMMSVCPSGAARATISAPTAPAAPGLFSTMIDWPQSLPRDGCMIRVSASAPPPGGNGTTMFTLYVGKVCANASGAATARQAIASLDPIMVLGSHDGGA